MARFLALFLFVQVPILLLPLKGHTPMHTCSRFAAHIGLPAVLLAALLPAPAAHAQTYTFDNHTYFLTTTAQNWQDAEAEAVGAGGHLVAVTSQEEEDFVTDTFASGDVPLWIGATDQDEEGTFQWSSGEAFDYTHWKPGEPNGGTSESWVTINWAYARGSTLDHSTWNDTPLDGTRGYGGMSDGPYFGIIEVAPEPSQWAALLVGALGLGALTLKARKRTT